MDLGHEVTLLALFDGDATLSFKGKLIKLNRKTDSRMFDWHGWSQLSAIIKSESYDIVQANAGDTLKYAGLSKLFFHWKGKLIFRNANKIGDFVNTRSKWLFNRLLFTQVDHVISVSEVCRKDFIKTFSWPNKQIDTVEIGIDMPPAFNPLADDIKNIFDRGPVIVNVGSLVKEKNHEGLLKIFSRLLEQVTSAQLIIIGKGPLGDQLKKTAEMLGISSKVHFIGYRTDVFDIVHHAQAFALPSLIEGLPGVLLEAQYAETPVVAHDVGGISEIIANDFTGYLVNKNDEIGFVCALHDALTDVKTSVLAKNARAQVLEKFHNVRITKRFLSVYEKILSLNPI
jgi:glycosyltransferase involved in cell wall biosynthesis